MSLGKYLHGPLLSFPQQVAQNLQAIGVLFPPVAGDELGLDGVAALLSSFTTFALAVFLPLSFFFLDFAPVDESI